VSWILARILVFLGAWILLLVSGRSGLFRDPGTFWHVLTGERIFQVGYPSADWLTFSFAGKYWIAHQWLGECLMAALHRLGGFDALLVAGTAGMALLLAWLFQRLRAAGVAPLWALLAVAICFVGSSHHFHMRPQLISIGLFAIMYARLIDFEAGRIGPRGLSLLVPLFLLWVNTHGAVVGGLLTLVLAIGGWTLTWLLGRPSPVTGGRGVVVLLALFAACAGAVLVNPYGLDMPGAWAAILQSSQLPNFIVEHGSLWRTRSFQVLLMVALYLLALVGHGRRLPPVTALLPLVWLVLTFQRVRQAPFFAVAATLALAHLIPHASTTIARWAARTTGTDDPAPASRALRSLPALMAVGALALVGLLHHRVPERGPLIVRFDPASWPQALLPELRRSAAQLPPGAGILNDMHLGGLVEYHVPRLRVMIDDRWELFGDAFMLAYFRGEPGWFEDLARRHDVRLAISQPGTELDRYLRAGNWQEIARAPAGALFRRDPTR
jgi:hypothetical protein